MIEGRREFASMERRSGTDRRTSNWRDATRHLPPSALEAVALRGCVETIRVLFERDDYDFMDELTMREMLDDIGVTIFSLDESIRRLATARAETTASSAPRRHAKRP